MRRLCVVACLVAVVLTAGGKSEARSSGMSMLKQRGAVLLSKWQQGAHGLLQAGMAAALCTTLACGGVTQAPEVAPVQPTAQYENSIGPEADTEDMLIITKLYGEGFGAARGIPAGSIEAYKKSKDMLPVQFYDGMMVHYIEAWQRLHTHRRSQRRQCAQGAAHARN